MDAIQTSAYTFMPALSLAKIGQPSAALDLKGRELCLCSTHILTYTIVRKKNRRELEMVSSMRIIAMPLGQIDMPLDISSVSRVTKLPKPSEHELHVGLLETHWQGVGR